MSRPLRHASKRAHLLACRMTAGLKQDQVQAARDLCAEFLKVGVGVCAPDPERLNLTVIIAALAALLSSCLDEYCVATESLQPVFERETVKKQYVM